MIGTLFGFRGRMGRLAYFGWICAVGGLGCGVLFMVLGGAFMTALARGAFLSAIGLSVSALLCLIPLFWISFALATKRLRDAGIPPLVVIPAVVLFSLFDLFVLSRQGGGLFHHSPAGNGVNVAYALVLLFWPSAEAKADDGGETRASGAVPWHERALSAASSLPPAQPVQSADPYPSHMPSHGQPRSFGRRTA